MIQLAHLATGAIAGEGAGGPLGALAAGLITHGLMDFAPHGEVHDTQWEMRSAVAGIAVLMLALGPRSPIVWGAIGGVLPDGEHVLPKRIRPQRAIYPSHRWKILHSNGMLRIPAWLQIVAGGAILGALAARGSQRTA